MLVTIYFPFCDGRSLFPGRSNLVQSRFSRPGETHRFSRNLGQLIDRPRGGFVGWIGENTICAVHRSIDVMLEAIDLQAFAVKPAVAFKRLFFDGLRGYFSIGLSFSPADQAANNPAPLVGLLAALSNVPVQSMHRPLQHHTLQVFAKLALDLYASGSVRKLTDLSMADYKRNVHFATPLIVVSLIDTEGVTAVTLDRQLDLDLRPPVQVETLGQRTFGGFIKWPGSTFVFVVASANKAGAANSRFLRAGIARLYLESYSLERMISLLQSPLFDQCDDEGRELIGISVNESLGRLHGAERPDIAESRESYDALVAIFARLFRPGHVADLENILKRLEARPNLRKALKRSLLVDRDSSIKAITYMEVIMGDKVHGDKIGGDKVGRDKIQNSGNFVGHDATDTEMVAGDKTTIYSRENVSQALAPVASAIADAPHDKATEAKTTLKALEEEAAKGKGASDTVVAKLLEGLVGLVPSAVTAVVSAFGTPILGGIAGPATKYVLDKLQGK